ncbi:signal peptide peptidase SppA 36K type [Cryptobacterium sp. CAG:338]|nr:signal peptide peptidase SppA 36K type [Cryptobacterium sp. CAG:338]
MPQEPNEPQSQSSQSQVPVPPAGVPTQAASENNSNPTVPLGSPTQAGAGYNAGYGSGYGAGYDVNNGAGFASNNGAGFDQNGGVGFAPSGGTNYCSNYGANPGTGYPAYASTKPTKSRGWIVGIVIVVALAMVMMFGMWSCSSAFSSAGSSVGSDADLLTSDAVAIITIDGTIQYDGTTSSPEGLKEQLDIAANNSYIKAVVLRVNSGGGTATAGEEMTEYLREFKETTGKPVVVSSAATNASAAYEISS